MRSDDLILRNVKQVWLGEVRLDLVRLGQVGQGVVWIFMRSCWFNSKEHAIRGAAWQGMAWQGKARQGPAWLGAAWLGWARQGLAWRGGAGQGKVLLSIGNRPGESDLIWIKQST